KLVLQFRRFCALVPFPKPRRVRDDCDKFENESTTHPSENRRTQKEGVKTVVIEDTSTPTRQVTRRFADTRQHSGDRKHEMERNDAPADNANNAGLRHGRRESKQDSTANHLAA